MNSLQRLRTFLAVGLSCALLLMSGCPQGENVILLEVQSPGDLGRLEIEVIPLDGSPEPAMTVREVNRSMEEIAATPVRIAIQLQGPRDVMVILRATLGDGRIVFAQRCMSVVGTVQDSVWLVVRDRANDQDDDGYPGVASAGCFRLGETGTPRSCPSDDPFLCGGTGRYDCDDDDSARFPFAMEVCGNAVDEDCDGVPADCADEDEDGFLPCATPTDTSGTCDCAEGNAAVYPGAPDPCRDGVDTDCDGADDLCDQDCDGYPTGLPSTTFNDCRDEAGVAEREASAAVHPNGALETIVRLADGDRVARGCPGVVTTTRSSDACSAANMGDGVDQDCNGFIDDGENCDDIFDRDRDGSRVCAAGVTMGCDRNDCDPGIRFGGAEVCGNLVDENGDGVVATCAENDTDRDGQVSLLAGGDDCDDTNNRIYLGAPEDCSTLTVSESCTVNTPCGTADSDRDNYRDEVDCDPMNPMVHPWAMEVECNGIDDDCDGAADELLLEPGDPMPRGCVVRAGRRTRVDFTDPADYDDSAYCGGCGITTDLNENCCASVVTDVSVPERCGACDNNCGPRSACESRPGNQYVCGCVMNAGNCNGGLADGCEVDLLTDELHCGACNNACEQNQTCEAGRCVCVDNFEDCNADRTDGCEINIQTSVLHCGACSDPCDLPNALESCMAASCGVATCATGFGDCDRVPANGCETSTDTTVANCGACGANCNDLPNVASAACTGGGCRSLVCEPNFADCNGVVADGCEVNLTNDANHCGSCPMVCGAPSGTPICVAGVCRVSMCPPTARDCDGAGANGCEVTTGTVASCGDCTTRVDCNATVRNANAISCNIGSDACTYGTCASGFADCDGNRANGCEVPIRSVTSCGSCGSLVNCSTQATMTNQISPSCSAAGVCTYGGCATNWGNCDMSAANGCERDLTLATTCGSCTNSCPALPNVAPGAMCSLSPAPTCAFSCQPGFADCNAGPGCETPLTSTTSCGSCGAIRNCMADVVMATGASCVGSTCTYTGACAANASDCDANRANGCERTNTTMSCGCGGANCTLAALRVTGGACTAGACTFSSCSGGYFDCDMMAANGCEVAPASVASCGPSCGARVNCTTAPNVAVATCTSGACGITSCTMGTGNCDMNAANGCETNLNVVTSCGAACLGRVDCTALPNVASATCGAGACGITTCDPGFADCDGSAANGCEVNLNANTTCGATCGGRVDCTALTNANATTCSAGACGITSCDAGFGNCDGNAANGCEVNLNAVATCGATCGAQTNCNTLTNANVTTCSAGACGITSCDAGFGNCDGNAANGCEVNLNAVATCGATCGAQTNCTTLTNANLTTCSAGACGITSCDAGFGNCDGNAANGCEVNLNAVATCGPACGMTTNCNGRPNVATSTCGAGACSITSCDAGFGNCDAMSANGCEANLNTDEMHCGTCPTMCGMSQTCTGGMCM